MEFDYRKIQEKKNHNITGLVIKKLIERTKKKDCEIAKDLKMPPSTLHDWINGVRTTTYEALDMFAKYFSHVLGDKTISYKTLCLGSDELLEELHDEIKALRERHEKELAEEAWKLAEAKRQLELFKDDKETA
jgi:transcriptional regulator with XRE-family HTH domain